MSIQIAEYGKVRELTEGELRKQVGSWGLQVEYADLVVNHLRTVQSEPIPVAEVGEAIGTLAEKPLAKIVRGSIQTDELVSMLKAEHVPLFTPNSSTLRYVLLPPRSKLCSPNPIEIAPLCVRRWSTFPVVDEPSRREQQVAGNRALSWLSETGWSVHLPDGPTRNVEAEKIAGMFLDLLDAAATHTFVRIDQAIPSVEALPPGGLPLKVLEALEQFIGELQLDDMLELDKVAFLSKVAGTSGGELHAPVLPEGLRDIATNLQRLDKLILQSETRLFAGKRSGFWLEQSDLGLPASEVEALLEEPRFSGRHVLGLPFARGQGVTGFPIAFSISDLHFGQGSLQGRRDSADDVYPELDAALLTVIEDWGTRVAKHRETNHDAPAWLILNGDILDFWSADLRDASGNQTQADASLEINPVGERYFRPSAKDALGRLKRIWDAHEAFFQTVHDWVEKHPMNFCVYTGGNHDDYLTRFSLGDVAAQRIHPSRCVFAAETFSLPALMAVFEHGHRKDDFNVARDGMGGSSLGELSVSMTVNPVARGGVASIQHAWVQMQSFAPANGIGVKEVKTLLDYYAQLNNYSRVDQITYEGWMGAINNIMPETQIAVAANAAGRELWQANRTKAKAAAVAKIDETVKGIMRVWLKDSFQELLKRLVGPVGLGLPRSVQNLLLDLVRKNHRELLGFSKATGICGMPIHVVGHTHDPSSTFPTFACATVDAQHVNTGTTIDMFEGKESKWEWINKKFSATSSSASLVPLNTSLACLIVASESDPEWVYVYGSPYRRLQSAVPGSHSCVTERLEFKNWNRLHRKIL